MAIVQVQVEIRLNDVVVDNDKHAENQLSDYLEVLVHVNDDIHKMNLKIEEKYVCIVKTIITIVIELK